MELGETTAVVRPMGTSCAVGSLAAEGLAVGNVSLDCPEVFRTMLDSNGFFTNTWSTDSFID